MKTQNPNADILINDRLPFWVRHGIIIVLLLVYVFYFLGNRIGIPLKEKINVIMELGQRDTDSMTCCFHIDEDYVNILGKFNSLNIVDDDGKSVLTNVQFETLRDNRGQYSVTIFVYGKFDIQTITKILDNSTHSCCVELVGIRESLSEYVLKSFFSLFNKD